MSNILIVDDEKNIRDGLRKTLEYERYDVLTEDNGRAAIKTIYKGGIDLVIADLKMPEMSGEELIGKILEFDANIPVIVLTGHGNIEKAVEIMRLGAYDFLTKPFNLDKLLLIIARALENKKIRKEKENLEKRFSYADSFYGMIGRSKVMENIYNIIKQVGRTKATVLIEGESGTGKELVADAIHKVSSRRDYPLIKINCAALSEGILESELFGHEKGSFTDAISKKIGRFEAANKGTIFLDEIGEISPVVQVKLLRVLEERTIERVGSSEKIKVDIRVIAATNKNLLKQVENGKFRKDLYYRLNVVKLKMPPLREHREDIPPLIDRFIKEFSAEHNKEIEPIEPKIYKLLSTYHWEGNVRQLRNTIENIVVLAGSGTITEENIPDELLQSESKIKNNMFSTNKDLSLANLEKLYINHILEKNNFNKLKTAKILEIERGTLYRKLKDKE